MDDFNKLLRNKLQKEVSSDFDKVFWNKFNDEFQEKKDFWIWIPTFALGTLAVALIITLMPRSPDNQDIFMATQAMESQEMLEDVDLLMEFDDVIIENEDWSILLNENGENS